MKSPWLKIHRIKDPIGQWVPRDKLFKITRGLPDMVYKFNSRKGVLKIYIKRWPFIWSRFFGLEECRASHCTCHGVCILRDKDFSPLIEVIS